MEISEIQSVLDESLPRRNAYLVKNAKGQVVEEGIGRIMRFENGEFMIV